MGVAGIMAGKVLCEALGLDTRKDQGVWIDCRVAEPMRVFVQCLASPLDLDRVFEAIRKLNPQEIQIIKEVPVSEAERYWNQIPEHVRDVIVKKIVSELTNQRVPVPAVEPAAVPVPPAAASDEDDAA